MECATEEKTMTAEKGETLINRFLNAMALERYSCSNFPAAGAISLDQHPKHPKLPRVSSNSAPPCPSVAQFERRVAVKRALGQGYHDRYILHYQPRGRGFAGMAAVRPGDPGQTYDAFIRRLFGIKPRAKLILTMEWYYGWQGCGVSPHCDARRKLGTHIFYFNTEADWKTEWGGEILLMDDQKKWKAHSAPEFDDLQVAASLDPRGNDSLLFQRTEHSWHGVRPLQSPSNELRKLFIVTVNVPTWQVLFRRLRGKDPDGYRITKAA